MFTLVCAQVGRALSLPWCAQVGRALSSPWCVRKEEGPYPYPGVCAMRKDLIFTLVCAQ